MPATQAEHIGSLQLAYIGDSVYDLYVRTQLMQIDGQAVYKLHKQAVSMVNCKAQSISLARIETLLCNRESDIVRRARNKNSRPPKGADPADYQRATGFEALIGYLYLSGQHTRLLYLLALSTAGDQT